VTVAAPLPLRLRGDAADDGTTRLRALLIATDLTLALLFLATRIWTDAPWVIRHHVDLDGEGNLAAFVASAKWTICALGIGIPLGLLRRDVERGERVLRQVLMLVFVLMAADEVAQLHEWFGTLLDRFVIDRRATAFAVTHYWMVLPAAALGALAVTAYRRMRRLSPEGARLVSTGLLLVIVGGAGVEVLSNLTAASPSLSMLQIVAEETLENLGASLTAIGVLRYNRDRGLLLLSRADASSPRAG
jgi:hypothetical protein